MLVSSRPSGITLYARIASVLRGKIASGNWPVGAMIPTVAELSREYGTAKITIRQAFKVLSPADAAGFESDLTGLLNRLNRAGAASLVVPSEYLEVVITR